METGRPELSVTPSQVARVILSSHVPCCHQINTSGFASIPVQPKSLSLHCHLPLGDRGASGWPVPEPPPPPFLHNGQNSRSTLGQYTPQHTTYHTAYTLTHHTHIHTHTIQHTHTAHTFSPLTPHAPHTCSHPHTQKESRTVGADHPFFIIPDSP